MTERDHRVRAGDAARELLGRLDRGGNLERARAVGAWREVAGAEVAAHAIGAAMRRGELLVYVDSPVWASELSALAEQYRTAINTTVGKELVRSLRFTVSKKVSEQHAWDAITSPPERAGEPRVEPVELDAAETAAIERMASAIHDEALRQAAIRAATADKQWRKGLKAAKSPQRASGGSTGPETDAEH